MTNYPASSTPNPSIQIEWERDYPVYAYRASSFPFRTREDDAEGHRIAQNLTSATALVYGMMAMSVIAELFLLGTLQQWW